MIYSSHLVMLFSSKINKSVMGWAFFWDEEDRTLVGKPLGRL